jgi:hypothetical protein
VDAIRVLADVPVVLDARWTEVYYWPITREYLADFAARNDVVDAVVRITDARGAPVEAPQRPYSVWHPLGVTDGQSRLLFDEEALTNHEQYIASARAAADAEQQYQRLRALHEQAVSEWLTMAAEGVDPLPQPPPEFAVPAPLPYDAYATEPETGPVVTLPAGEYRIALVAPDGSTVAGSDRRVVSFEPRRHGSGYVVVPASRWTQPLAAFDPQDTIYVTGESDLYLQPVAAEEYDGSMILRLLRPQTVDVAEAERYVWVPGGPGGSEIDRLGDTELRVTSGGGDATVPQRGYRVLQVAGTLRGYTIEEDATSTEPDFRAMHLAVGGASVDRVALVDGAGASVAGSERAVRRVNDVPEWMLYLPAAVPLLAIALLRVARRQRTGGSTGPSTTS